MTGPAPPRAGNVPFNVLAPGVASIREALDAAIAAVLDRGWFLIGPELEAFEAEFGQYHGIGYEAVGVASGTDALTLALRALGIQRDDEVLVPANAGVPPVAAVRAAGAWPVFCDVDPRAHTLDPTEIARRVTSRTRAVIVVHLYGHAADMASIGQLAAAHGLKVLEDCAQAHGASVQGRRVGTLGDAAAFSFYPTKNLGALGDAGAVLTADPHIAEQTRMLRQYGWRRKYVSEVHSTVSRMDELQAAVLRVKLRHLDAWNAARRRLAARYRSRLPASVSLPPEDGVFHLFVIQSRRRDALRAFLTQNGVATDIHYPIPAHLQQPYARYGGGVGSLPNTERLADQVLSLPMYPELSEQQVDWVARVVGMYGA